MCSKTFSIKLKFIIFFLFVASTQIVLAQSRPQKNWIFGSGEVITFGDDADRTADQGDNLPMGARAVANDPVTGDLLFYTDGNIVYDACGNQIATGLGGDPNANQPVVIAPNPTPTEGSLEYYIIVNNGGNIVYREITVVTNPTPPPIAPNCQFNYNISGSNQTTGINGVSDAMAVVPNDDNSGFWLVTQTPASDEYRVSEITATNIGPTQTYNLGTPIDAVNFSYSPASNQLAASGAEVQILNINPATGQLTLEQTIGGIGQDAVDTEWSADANNLKLYISTGAGGQLYQYDLDAGALNIVPGSGVATNSFGLKRGPDGNIYHLYQATGGGPFLMGEISAADSVFSLVSYSPNQFGGNDFDTEFFPEFAPLSQQNYSVSFTTVGNCQNQPTQFFPNFPPGTPQPDSLIWLIDGQQIRGFSPSYTYQNPGGGQVTVAAFWPDTMATFSGAATIQQFDVQIQIPQDTTICPGDVATLNAEPQSGQQGGGGTGGGSYQYLWSTGESTAEIEVDEAGVYWVVVTDQSSGCATYAESNVKEYEVENQTYNVWYFGNNAGLDFNTLYDPDGETGEVTGIGDGTLDAPEAVAAVSDGNGDILFYTDGETMVFVTKDPNTGDNIHQPIPVAGNDLGGDPASSQVIMVQVPDTDGMYYVFTTTAVENGGYELRYSVVDLKAQAVVSANNLLFAKSTESIAIFGGQGSNAVLVAHEYGNNNFRAYPISAQGIGQPVISSEGSVSALNSPEDGRGYMKFGGISSDSTSTVLAVPFGDKVEIFDFDLTTLEITGLRSTVDFTGRGFPYGVEFQGDTVVVSTNQGLFYADASGVPPNVTPQAGPLGNNFGALQVGPDGQIYVAEDGAGSIRSVSVSQSGINFGNSVDLQGATSGLGLPNFINQGGNSFQEPSISVDNACAGNETSFAATPTDPIIDEFAWTIFRMEDDGSLGPQVNGIPADSLSEDAFSHVFEETGNFRAVVNITNPCGLDTTLTQDFTVVAGIELDALQPVVNLCQGGAQLSAVSNPGANFTFEWVQLNAQGGGNLPQQNTITVTEAGNYQITVSDTIAGCTVDSTTLVVDARPPINLPDSITLCQDETRTLDVTIASPAPAPDGYQWQINSVAAGNDPMIDIDTSVPGLFNYSVRVTDNSPEGCFIDDTVVVTVQEIPAFNLAQSPTSGCGEDNGSIDLTLTSDPSATYQFSWTDNQGNPVGTSEDLNNLTAGVYNVTVTIEGGCSAQGSITVGEGATDFQILNTGTENSGCDDNSGSITVTLDDASAFPISFSLSGASQQVGGPVPAGPGNDFTLSGLSAGTYNLEVVSNGGCTQGQTGIVIDQAADSVQFSFTEVPPQNICGVADADITIDYNITDNWEFLWEDPNGNILVNNQEIPSITVTESGIYTVTVTDVDDPNLCPSTQTFEVNIFENPVIEIQQTTSESCETGEEMVTVEFSEEPPPGDYVYSWTVDGNFVGNGPTITATQSGDYEVFVRNIQTGCFANRVEPVVVNDPIIVDILFDIPCEGQEIAMFAFVNIPREEAEFAWFGPDGNRLSASNDIGDSLIVQTDMPQGTYEVRVSRGECEVTEDANFQRFATPVSELAEGPLTICSEDSDPEVSQVVLDAGFAPQIEWTIPDGTFNNTQTVTADQGGMYYVVLTNEFGCSVSDSVEVLDDCTPQIYAPNAFVPTGTNSEFFVYTQYVADDGFEVFIYNRWGELIFQSDSRDFRWDGTTSGEPVPPGTYPYVIRYKGSTTDSSDQIYEERGGVTVLR